MSWWDYGYQIAGECVCGCDGVCMCVCVCKNVYAAHVHARMCLHVRVCEWVGGAYVSVCVHV